MSSAVLASLPGPICQQYQTKRDALVARGVANGAPIFAARASGSEVVDLDGRRIDKLIVRKTEEAAE